MQTMHLLPGVAIQPNLELKSRPKPVLGFLPLAFALPDPSYKLTRIILSHRRKAIVAVAAIFIVIFDKTFDAA
jgi:hypothetical protein